MKKKRILFFMTVLVIVAAALFKFIEEKKGSCVIGAFVADNPRTADIEKFKTDYGKKPAVVMIFLDWGKFVDEKISRDVYSEECVLFVTWEPWDAPAKQGIDYDGLLGGKYDEYIKNFTSSLKKINRPVLLRFGHEMNGNWYPWSGSIIGAGKFVDSYKYVKDMFDEARADNVKWVFSVNWEDVPKGNNNFMLYYPGDDYVDFVGIDGYNWGDTQPWNRWMSFKEIFSARYKQVIKEVAKPLIISEFGSAESGGNKAKWIKQAMADIKAMKKIKAFVLFNVDKEAKWRFSPLSAAGKEFKKQLQRDYFTGGTNFILGDVK